MRRLAVGVPANAYEQTSDERANLGVSTGQRDSFESPASAPPLIFDLDGTLTPSDATFEQLATMLGRNPLGFIRALLTAVRSRSAMKANLSKATADVATHLPLNPDVLEFAQTEKALGREVHLVTASHQTIADGLAKRIDIFDSATGSTTTNLKAGRKAEYLRLRFPLGYSYVGDSSADHPVWRGASSGSVVGSKGRGFQAFESSGVTTERVFSAPSSSARDWIKQLRLHQWAKNLMLFIALFVGHEYGDIANWLTVAAGFACLGIVASGTYVLNDLVDLAADRAHATKRHRPLAAGRIKVAHALAAVPILIGSGTIIASLTLPPRFAGLLVLYLATTLAYSFRLKQLALIDTFVIGSLFTIRVAMGATLLGIAISHWLLVFSELFFISLALAKRHVELIRAKEANRALLSGRGYQTSDARLTLSLGIHTAGLSILVIILYLIEEAFDVDAYASPGLLWAAPAIVSLWLARVWMWADRGWLDDDPVIFALKDRPSLLYGAALAATFVLAAVGI